MLLTAADEQPSVIDIAAARSPVLLTAALEVVHCRDTARGAEETAVVQVVSAALQLCHMSVTVPTPMRQTYSRVCAQDGVEWVGEGVGVSPVQPF